MKKPSDEECDVLIQQTGFVLQAGHAGVLYTQFVSLSELRTIARHAYIAGREHEQHKAIKDRTAGTD